MKVNDYCEFPENLDMRAYTQGYLRRKEKEENGEALDENDLADQQFPPQYYQYKLRGVVIHAGTADSGHYYSLIKTNAEKWLEFNDNIVRPFDIRDLSDEAFGGEEVVSGNLGGSPSKSVREKIRNAYLLFYERVSYFDEEGKAINSLLMSNVSQSQDLDVIPPKILEEIKADNFKFQMTKYMFDRDYSDLIQRLLKENVNEADLAGEATASLLNIGKLSILYFLTVILRARDRDRLPNFLREVKTALINHYELSEWLLSAFRQIDTIQEFLISCQVLDMKYFAAGLLKTALGVVYQRDSKQSYEEFKKNSVIVPFINSFIYALYDYADQYKVMPRFFEVFSVLAGLGIYTKSYLLENRMIGRTVFIMLNQKLPGNSHKDYRDLVDFRSLKSDDGGLGDSTKEDESKKHLDSIKSISEMIDKRKEKMKLEGLALDFNMLASMVAKLGLSIPQPGMPDDYNGCEFIKINIEESERTTLYSMEALRVLLRAANTKNTRKLVSALVAHVSYKKDSLVVDILKMLSAELNAKDDQELKVYLMALEKLMQVKDGSEKIRVERGMQCFIDVLRDNSSFYKATEICIDYLFKMCSRNQLVLKFASENKTLSKFLETWIRDFTNPLQGLTTQKLKMFKKKTCTILTQTITFHATKFNSKMNDRIAKLRMLLKNDLEGLGPDYDSDEDYSEHKFEPAEKIDYNIEGNTWVPAVVNDCLDEMISIKLQEQSPWVHTDNDKIAPYLKMQNHFKNEVDFIK